MDKEGCPFGDEQVDVVRKLRLLNALRALISHTDNDVLSMDNLNRASGYHPEGYWYEKYSDDELQYCLSIVHDQCDNQLQRDFLYFVYVAKKEWDIYRSDPNLAFSRWGGCTETQIVKIFLADYPNVIADMRTKSAMEEYAKSLDSTDPDRIYVESIRDGGDVLMIFHLCNDSKTDEHGFPFDIAFPYAVYTSGSWVLCDSAWCKDFWGR